MKTLKDLVRIQDELIHDDDLLGDTHVHTSYSDGRDSLEEIVHSCKQAGYKHIFITDHGKKLTIAGGMSEDDIRRQKKRIKELQITMNLKIFHGIELNVDINGEVDYDNNFLRTFEFVLLATHSQPSKNIQQRLSIAMRKLTSLKIPTIVAHPTGRQLGYREGAIDDDWEAIFKEGASLGVIFEINCSPDRMDLDEDMIKRAKKCGVKKFSIGTDAHSVEHLRNIEYGINIARRAHLSKKEVINCFPHPFKEYKIMNQNIAGVVEDKDEGKELFDKFSELKQIRQSSTLGELVKNVEKVSTKRAALTEQQLKEMRDNVIKKDYKKGKK